MTLTLTAPAFSAFAGFIPVNRDLQMIARKRIKFLCDRIELQTPLADDWDWSTWDRLEPMPEPECECVYIDVDQVDASMCDVHGSFQRAHELVI